MMAISKKGTRKIVVKGSVYLWKVREVDPIGVRIVVVAEENKRSVLIINSTQNRAKQHVLPFEVAFCIEKALSKGWKPNSDTGCMELRVEFQMPYSNLEAERKPKFI